MVSKVETGRPDRLRVLALAAGETAAAGRLASGDSRNVKLIKPRDGAGSPSVPATTEAPAGEPFDDPFADPCPETAGAVWLGG